VLERSKAKGVEPKIIGRKLRSVHWQGALNQKAENKGYVYTVRKRVGQNLFLMH
jgi:hypothetical protein